MYGAATAINGVARMDSAASVMASVLARLMAGPRIVVFDPNIAVEDIPRRQALLAGALPGPGQRFKPALGTAGSQINEMILAGVRRR